MIETGPPPRQEEEERNSPEANQRCNAPPQLRRDRLERSLGCEEVRCYSTLQTNLGRVTIAQCSGLRLQIDPENPRSKNCLPLSFFFFPSSFLLFCFLRLLIDHKTRPFCFLCFLYFTPDPENPRPYGKGSVGCRPGGLRIARYVPGVPVERIERAPFGGGPPLTSVEGGLWYFSVLYLNTRED
ncbi:hypothetical protein BO82DRAFT_148176 [Aspergillus uvarum CBS 121591]|uniref:Uncharacterized protein n=1 Tax=Aspergillus uvarum CBS 121591 TaxID=1448315 RepID=A0A319C1I0_9EURO|nr:hypothetical protein BO82DRAFT_148176 [Aspergillus uvarum CBS 121591]PYH78934.1 hypothetical protein BO82DRAFT_148176 [Aspergillus uvarum CBS 121591]